MSSCLNLLQVSYTCVCHVYICDIMLYIIAGLSSLTSHHVVSPPSPPRTRSHHRQSSDSMSSTSFPSTSNYNTTTQHGRSLTNTDR